MVNRIPSFCSFYSLFSQCEAKTQASLSRLSLLLLSGAAELLLKPPSAVPLLSETLQLSASRTMPLLENPASRAVLLAFVVFSLSLKTLKFIG